MMNVFVSYFISSSYSVRLFESNSPHKKLLKENCFVFKVLQKVISNKYSRLVTFHTTNFQNGFNRWLKPRVADWNPKTTWSLTLKLPLNQVIFCFVVLFCFGLTTLWLLWPQYWETNSWLLTSARTGTREKKKSTETLGTMADKKKPSNSEIGNTSSQTN